MSYTPPDQELDESKQRLLDALDEVRKVCTARIRNSNNWADDHIIELQAIRSLLNELEVKLVRI